MSDDISDRLFDRLASLCGAVIQVNEVSPEELYAHEVARVAKHHEEKFFQQFNKSRQFLHP